MVWLIWLDHAHDDVSFVHHWPEDDSKRNYPRDADSGIGHLSSCSCNYDMRSQSSFMSLHRARQRETDAKQNFTMSGAYIIRQGLMYTTHSEDVGSRILRPHPCSDALSPDQYSGGSWKREVVLSQSHLFEKQNSPRPRRLSFRPVSS